MPHQHVRIAAATAAAVLALAGTAGAAPRPAAPAPASTTRTLVPHTQHVSATVTVPAFGTAEATVPCPAGTYPSGGGARSSDGVFLIRSRPGQNNTWVAGGHNRYSVPGTVSAFVICTSAGSHNGGTTGTSVHAGWEGGATGSCHQDEVATGIGWSTAPLMYVSSAGVFGGKSSVDVLNEDSSSPHDVQITPMCFTTPHSQHTGPQILMQGYQTASATVSCPAGEVPTGGGGSTGFRTYLITSSGTPDGRGWEVRATNTTAYPRSLTAQVICTRP
ncbi:hypothetical protein [Streptomyces sp. NPDC089799]|uniref:hypothetical protein n=1 Tax=Streptomyces sp. NPDC089799 TaxID=3155066 RepID=UPI0034335F48